MTALFKLFRSINWAVAAILALGLTWLAVTQQQQAFRYEAEKAQALRDGKPPLIDIAEFDPERDVHLAREVNLRVQVNPQYNYHLVEQHRRRSDVERFMWVLFAPDDPADSRDARAVMVMTEAERDAMVATMSQPADILSALASQGIAFDLNGQITPSPDLESMAEEALGKAGIRPAPGMVYVEPFAFGREKGLAPNGAAVWVPSWLFGGMAALFALTAISKFRNRKKRAEQKVVQKLAVTPHEEAAPQNPRATSTAAKGLALGVLCLVIGPLLGTGIITGLGALLIVIWLMRLCFQGMGEILKGSSTRLRNALARADAQTSAKPLGRSVSVGKSAFQATPFAPAAAVTHGDTGSSAIQSVPSLGQRLSAGPLPRLAMAGGLMMVVMGIFGNGPVLHGLIPGAGTFSFPAMAEAPLPSAATAPDAGAPVSAGPQIAPVAAQVDPPVVQTAPPPGRKLLDGTGLRFILGFVLLTMAGALAWRRIGAGRRPPGPDPFDRLAQRLRKDGQG